MSQEELQGVLILGHVACHLAHILLGREGRGGEGEERRGEGRGGTDTE